MLWANSFMMSTMVENYFLLKKSLCNLIEWFCLPMLCWGKCLYDKHEISLVILFNIFWQFADHTWQTNFYQSCQYYTINTLKNRQIYIYMYMYKHLSCLLNIIVQYNKNLLPGYYEKYIYDKLNWDMSDIRLWMLNSNMYYVYIVSTTHTLIID